MSDVTVQCPSSTCTVVVQLDASTAIQQVRDAFPTFADLMPIFGSCVGVLIVAWSIKAARRALD